jgi:diguanylate cyclase (GGDEF)-like protein
MWRWASRWASWRRVSLLCLEKIGLLQPYVAPASLAEMAPRLESLTSTRLRELVMPPDFMAAYLEKTNKTSRKLLASWCITIGLINIPGGILDMFEAAAYWRLITLEYRIIITCGFVLAAQLYQRYPLRRAEHIPIIVLANATILISAISTPQSDLFEFHQIHIIMAVVLACSGLIYLPLDGAAAAWLAGSSIVSMTLAISVSQLATVDKASLILFFTCVLTALVQARRTQNVYQHQLFLLRARDELRTEEANRRNEQLSSIAYVDRLTDVPNRRYFEEIADAIDAAPARALPLAICMLDVDHFKNLNDELGHTQGDRCLRVVAATIRNSLRNQSDMLARYGGEEFILILPNTSREQALEIAERIREAVLHLNHPNPGTTRGHVTISVGVACTARPMKVEPLLRQADEALYRAKSTGRNKVCE